MYRSNRRLPIELSNSYGLFRSSLEIQKTEYRRGDWNTANPQQNNLPNDGIAELDAQARKEIGMHMITVSVLF
jgi:hypothetical protein